MIVNSEVLSDSKPLVTVKGTRDGLLFLLDEQADVDELCAYIETLVHGPSGTLFDGPVMDIVVDYGKRALSPSDSRRILDVFHRRENFVLKAWGGGTTTRQSLFQRKAKAGVENIYHGLIRSGEPVTFDGDVVIIGDVNPSGHVQATGDIFVFGRLLGIAHAGIEGDRSAVIAATEFAPMQLRIADVVGRAPNLRATMEYAYLEDNQLMVSEMKNFVVWNKKRRLNRDRG
ncbi:septum site-determining protein MinC [Alicyclobacillus acidiphilus]|uniref:septum site-determining protein MinC n=1 Tax=Alicyclobacillus acidiphilus TaxID=182455 RepID=UPI00082B134F|nr:septum site-determining protein MinC [Alicyclobacillus acidiphilus]